MADKPESLALSGIDVMDALDEAIEHDADLQAIESSWRDGRQQKVERQYRMLCRMAAHEASVLADRFWSGHIPIALPVFLYFTKWDYRQRAIWLRAGVKVSMTANEKSMWTMTGGRT